MEVFYQCWVTWQVLLSFSLLLTDCGQSYLHGLCLSPLLHFDTTTGRTALQLTTLGVFMLHELPARDGVNRDRTISAVQTSALDLEEIHLQTTALRCHGWYQFFVQRSVYLPLGSAKVVKFLPPATTMEEVDYATLGSAFDRINSENNCLRREVSSLNGALSELFSVVGRLREDLDGITADHDRLAEQVGWQHVGMVRLGGFNSYQSLSIQHRQQVFARERRNMMAYRAIGPDGFMSTVLHQEVVGPAKRLQCSWRVGARLDYPGGGNCRHPTSH